MAEDLCQSLHIPGYFYHVTLLQNTVLAMAVIFVCLSDCSSVRHTIYALHRYGYVCHQTFYHRLLAQFKLATK